jgi:hypothetical protein
VLDLVQAKLKGKKTLVEFCEEFGQPHNRVRAWLERGRVPEEYVAKLAEALGVTEGDLYQSGMSTAASRTPKRPSQGIDVVPVARAIMELRLQSCSLEKFVKVSKAVELLRQRGLAITENLIKSLLSGCD